MRTSKKDSAAQAAFRTDARAGSEAAIKERKRPRSNEADFILRRGMEYFRARAHTYRRVDTILVWNAVRIDPRAVTWVGNNLNHQTEQDNRRYDRLGRCGLILIAVGTACQIWGAWLGR